MGPSTLHILKQLILWQAIFPNKGGFIKLLKDKFDLFPNIKYLLTNWLISFNKIEISFTTL